MGEPQYHLEGIVRTKTETMEDFEGPLDVIFELLSKNKIEIQDVSITAILEQYLAYLDEMKRLDMEIASEFITMASHLMLIKTKMLLSAAEQAEAESELDLLRQSLIERKRKEAMEQIRVAVAELEPRNEIGRCLFTKQPEPLKRDCGRWIRSRNAMPGSCRRRLRILRASSARNPTPLAGRPARCFASWFCGVWND